MCYFFNALCGKVIDLAMLDRLHKNLVETLCLFKKYFHESLIDMMSHLTEHLVREIRFCGPVLARWMYRMERYMKVLKGYLQNHRRLERCIVEFYILLKN